MSIIHGIYYWLFLSSAQPLITCLLQSTFPCKQAANLTVTLMLFHESNIKTKKELSTLAFKH